MTAVKQIRINRPRVRRERPRHEVLPPDPRDPDVVRAKENMRRAARQYRPDLHDQARRDAPAHREA
jgi:hypothetical protein